MLCIAHILKAFKTFSAIPTFCTISAKTDKKKHLGTPICNIKKPSYCMSSRPFLDKYPAFFTPNIRKRWSSLTDFKCADSSPLHHESDSGLHLDTGRAQFWLFVITPGKRSLILSTFNTTSLQVWLYSKYHVSRWKAELSGTQWCAQDWAWMLHIKA